MNRNRKTKILAVTLGAGLAISSVPMSVSASPIAGAVASVYNANNPNGFNESSIIEAASPLSGTNLALSNILAMASSGLNGVSTEETVSEGAPTAAGDTVPYESIAIATVGDFVNIRSEADSGSEALGKLYSNGYAEVVENNGEWVQIRSGSVEGYIKSEFLSIGDEEYILSVSRPVAHINADVLNIREEMSTESRVISRSGVGASLDIVDDSMYDEGWIRVNTGDGEGFVSSEFVTVDRAYASVAESAAEEAARLAAEAAAAEAARAAQEQRNNPTASSSSQPVTAPRTPAPEVHYNPPAGTDGSSVVNYATQFVGNPYVYGGTSLTNGADCSGFVMSVYNQFGVSLPHSSSSMRSVGYGVGTEDMQPGDIVCYSGHVGIYAGGGNIVHASNARDGIKVSSAYYRNILAVRRIF